MHLLGMITALLAQAAGGEADSARWLGLSEDNWQGMLLALIFGCVGIILLVLGFKVFDWMTPKIDIQRELAEKQNVAVAIVCAAIILGVSFIVATVVR